MSSVDSAASKSCSPELSCYKLSFYCKKEKEINAVKLILIANIFNISDSVLKINHCDEAFLENEADCVLVAEEAGGIVKYENIVDVCTHIIRKSPFLFVSPLIENNFICAVSEDVHKWIEWIESSALCSNSGNANEEEGALDYLERFLPQGNSFLCDKEKLCLADVFLFCAIKRLLYKQHESSSMQVISKKIDLNKYKLVSSYLQRVSFHPLISSSRNRRQSFSLSLSSLGSFLNYLYEQSYSFSEDELIKQDEQRLVLRYTRVKNNSPTLESSSPKQIPQRQALPEERSHSKEKFYVTAAINYTNGLPHIGHAYEAVICDVFARYHRIFGRDVFFLCGTDEYGQKIANTARRENKKPIEICTFYANKFKDLAEKLCIDYDFFIRTTSPAHSNVCTSIFKKVFEKGDIYKGIYVGWYNEREETFVSENEAKLMNYKDNATGLPLQRMEEESYFFRMSKYQSWLLEEIKKNENLIQPSFRRNEILNRLQNPLEDLSISRCTFDWGIQIPADEGHVMYVWFDALLNYLSGIEIPVESDKEKEGEYQRKKEKFERYWPPDLQIIGKDITWFHTVIWPIILKSAQLDLPKAVFSHGFVQASDGRKMSKTLGNVVDPYDILEKFDADVFRYYLIKETKLGGDISFEVESMIFMQNSDLADIIGNLVHRCTSLCVKMCDGKVPSVDLYDETIPFDFASLKRYVDLYFKKLDLQRALELIMNAAKELNKFMTDTEPWKQGISKEYSTKIIKILLECTYILAHFLFPFVPKMCNKIFLKLGSEKSEIPKLSEHLDNLIPGTVVHVGDILVNKHKIENAQIPIQRVEMRLGEITAVYLHPKDSNFVCISVNLSPTEKKDTKLCIAQISRHFSSLEKFVGLNVVCVCNLKHSSVKGIQPSCSILALLKYDSTDESSLLSLTLNDSCFVTFLTCQDNYGVKDTKESNNAKGSLVDISNYPTVLKKLEKVTRKDLDYISKFLYLKNSHIFFKKDAVENEKNENLMRLNVRQNATPIIVPSSLDSFNNTKNIKFAFL